MAREDTFQCLQCRGTDEYIGYLTCTPICASFESLRDAKDRDDFERILKDELFKKILDAIFNESSQFDNMEEIKPYLRLISVINNCKEFRSK